MQTRGPLTRWGRESFQIYFQEMRALFCIEHIIRLASATISVVRSGEVRRRAG